MKIWRGNTVKIGTTVALGALTLIFFFQNLLVRRPKVHTRVRRYLLFIPLLGSGGMRTPSCRWSTF